MEFRDVVLVFAVPLLVGWFATQQARSVAKEYRRCQSWKGATGTILSSRLIGWGKGKSAEVLYEFFIPDRVFGGSICPPGCEVSDPSVYLKRYPPGRSVTVHYDPESRHSYLELPKKRTIALWRALAAICLFFPLVYLLWILVFG